MKKCTCVTETNYAIIHRVFSVHHELISSANQDKNARRVEYMRHKTYANRRLKSVGAAAALVSVYSSVAASAARTTQFPYTFPIVKETMSYKLNWEILALLFRGIATINTEKPLYQPTTIDLLKTLHFCVWALAQSWAPPRAFYIILSGSVNGALLLFCPCTPMLSFIIIHQLIQVPYCKFSIQSYFRAALLTFAGFLWAFYRFASRDKMLFGERPCAAAQQNGI